VGFSSDHDDTVRNENKKHNCKAGDAVRALADCGFRGPIDHSTPIAHESPAMSFLTNPFPNDADRGAIWTMLVERDIDAFVKADWSMVDGDFVREGFLGIGGGKSDNPDSWRVAYPTLEDYRDDWLSQAHAAQQVNYGEDQRTGIFRCTTLRDIDINGDIAVAHKKFDGDIALADGSKEVMNWQTLYFCRKVGGVWKLTGFVGYIPFPMGTTMKG
jgi:hypothetical protein